MGDTHYNEDNQAKTKEVATERNTQISNQPKSKLSALLKLAESLVTPLTVALVGFMGSQYLAQRERAETDFRFYSDLMSRREVSDSELRKEMFNSVLSNFLKPVGERPSEESILNLELLAYNFHDSLDLAPLFKEVYGQIFKGKLRKDEKLLLLARLDGLTDRVKEKQISTLEEAGARLDETIFFDNLEVRNGEVIKGHEVLDKPFYTKFTGNHELPPEKMKAKLELLRIDKIKREVMARLIVHAPTKVEVVISVGFFDFPMLNNIRLPDSNRCAVVLKEFGQNSAEFVFVFFPASRASLKDKPYYDELTGYLQSKRSKEREK